MIKVSALLWSSAFLLCLCGCAADQVENGSVASTTAVRGGETKTAVNPKAAPPNYRQIVALKLSMIFNKGGVTSAEISEPGETWMGLIRGGMQPAVCATVIQRETGRSNWIFTFQNGQLDEAIHEPGAIYCMGRPMAALKEMSLAR